MAQLKRKTIEPDPLYNNLLVAKFVNYIMQRGQKQTARKIVYGAFEIIKKKTKKDPIEIFEKAIQNVSPMLEVRSKRIGGAKYQVPVEVPKERRVALAMRWIIESISGSKGKTAEKLANELMEAANNAGKSIKKKDNVHKMAEANKAFAHFAW